MKRFIVLCLAGFLVSAAGAQQSVPMNAPLTKDQQEKVKERNQLWQEAQKLRADGKLAEATSAAEKMLAIQREVFGNVHPDVAVILQFLAQTHERRDDFPAA